MHAHNPKLHRPRMVLELKNYTIVTSNDTIKTASEGKKDLD